jgi:hypothetical protein
MNLIVSGCSFSVEHTWPTHIANYNKPNLATPGAGMTTIAQNLIMYLEINPSLNRSNSCIIFNITKLDRIDTMCALDHPDANCRMTSLGFGWINEGSFVVQKSPFYSSLQKNMGLEQIQTTNILHTISLINYLENHGYAYGILLLEDLFEHNDVPDFFKNFLNKKLEKIIKFDQNLGMFEHAQQQDQLEPDNFHPNDLANQYFSQSIQQYLALNSR